MNSYFCSYIVINDGAVYSYGDLAFKSEQTDVGELLGDVKKTIIDNYHGGNKLFRVVVTALNKID